MFKHLSHSSTVIKVAVYPRNPEVVFSVDKEENIHVWWPDSKRTVFNQLPQIGFLDGHEPPPPPQCNTPGASSVKTSDIQQQQQSNPAADEEQPLDLHHGSTS